MSTSTFTVSARKYRPDTFDNVLGQEHVTKPLRNAIINGTLGHAFLFCGPRGVGKTTCARILAKSINCLNPSPQADACGVCDACEAFSHNQAFNIYELDAASNNSVDDIRGLNEQVRFAPQTGKYKIYIIDEVHMLSSAAFNAFLKTLEEPPSYAKFILATTEKHKILPTILSRCQIFDFKRISIQSAMAQLRIVAKAENINIDDRALHTIAEKADGAMRDALSLFDRLAATGAPVINYELVIDNLSILDYDYFFQFMDMMLEENLSSIILLFNNLMVKGFDPHQVVLGLQEHCRNLLVAKHPDTVALLEQPEEILLRFHQQASKVDVSLLMSAISLLSNFDIEFKTAKNPRLHAEIALMKLSYLPKMLNWAELEKKND